MDNWEPINFVDYKNEPSGIGASIVEILNKKLDNKYKLVLQIGMIFTKKQKLES